MLQYLINYEQHKFKAYLNHKGNSVYQVKNWFRKIGCQSI